MKGTIEEMNMPGHPAPGQGRDEAGDGPGAGADSFEYCVTPEEAKRPGGGFLRRQGQRNCRYDHFTMGGGKIDAAMRCERPGIGARMTMEMDGDYSPDHYQRRTWR